MTLETVPGNRLQKQHRNKHQGRRPVLRRSHYHISSENGSTLNPGSSTKTEKKSTQMTRSLRHDHTVLREEDGGVEFRILAPMFRSEFASSQHWSVRTWLNYLQKEEDLRRDPSIVWIHTLLIPSYTFKQFKAILEENTLILHCKTTSCCRTTSPSTHITLEAPMTYTLSSNQD